MISFFCTDGWNSIVFVYDIPIIHSAIRALGCFHWPAGKAWRSCEHGQIGVSVEGQLVLWVVVRGGSWGIGAGYFLRILNTDFPMVVLISPPISPECGFPFPTSL